MDPPNSAITPVPRTGALGRRNIWVHSRKEHGRKRKKPSRRVERELEVARQFQLSLLPPTGPILSSALFVISCEQTTAALGPGDSLLLYTDGVTESHGPGGMFGQERLVTAILGGRRGFDLLDALLSEVVAFSNSPGNQDDITLLALDLAEPAAADDGVPGV